MSSGTGSTGAAAAAVARGMAKWPVRVLTPAGPIALRRSGRPLPNRAGENYRRRYKSMTTPGLGIEPGERDDADPDRDAHVVA